MFGLFVEQQQHFPIPFLPFRGDGKPSNVDGRRRGKTVSLSGSKSQLFCLHKMPVICPSCCVGLGTSSKIEGRGGCVESREGVGWIQVGQLNFISVVNGCMGTGRELWVSIEIL